MQPWLLFWGAGNGSIKSYSPKILIDFSKDERNQSTCDESRMVCCELTSGVGGGH